MEPFFYIGFILLARMVGRVWSMRALLSQWGGWLDSDGGIEEESVVKTVIFDS